MSPPNTVVTWVCPGEGDALLTLLTTRGRLRVGRVRGKGCTQVTLQFAFSSPHSVLGSIGSSTFLEVRFRFPNIFDLVT